MTTDAASQFSNGDVAPFVSGREAQVEAALGRLAPAYGDRQVAYSQEGEDLIVRRLLAGRRDGFYVDIGAHHPTRFSNTYLLYCDGWHGLNVDASAELVAHIAKARPRDTSVCCLVASGDGERTFHVFDEQALNTASPEAAAMLAATDAAYRVVELRQLRTRSLAALLGDHLPAGQAIDLLNIDVEGVEEEVLASNDWTRYRPELVLLEQRVGTIAAMLEHPTTRLMTGFGYEPVSKLYNTSIFRRRPDGSAG